MIKMAKWLRLCIYFAQPIKGTLLFCCFMEIISYIFIAKSWRIQLKVFSKKTLKIINDTDFQIIGVVSILNPNSYSIVYIESKYAFSDSRVTHSVYRILNGVVCNLVSTIYIRVASYC